MSYHDNQCPCGLKKPRDTMLCNGCMTDFKDTKEMKVFTDETASIPSQRAAALTSSPP